MFSILCNINTFLLLQNFHSLVRTGGISTFFAWTILDCQGTVVMSTWVVINDVEHLALCLRKPLFSLLIFTILLVFQCLICAARGKCSIVWKGRDLEISRNYIWTQLQSSSFCKMLNRPHETLMLFTNRLHCHFIFRYTFRVFRTTPRSVLWSSKLLNSWVLLVLLVCILS